ncbi:hypothetical protein ABW19_dt0202422 [Dactylella cylindrospora]|nr:hypothetical protein ABW19_dt0202422 [Dactylella cylindrospora]
MANEHANAPKSFTKRSCNECRKRHLKCELKPQPDGSMRCIWCIEHGIECYQQGDETSQKNGVKPPPNDGSMIMNGQTSAHAGFQLSGQSFCASESSIESILRIRQDITEKNSIPWTDVESMDDKLNLDKIIANYLEDLFFEKVQPYIPIITRSYLKSIKPSQLLLAAIYGVAARLSRVLVSSRDFTHIKKVLNAQLIKLVNNYKPSLQACIALTLIHLTIELQTDGINDVEAWPLRLGMLVRMALELKLHKRTFQSRHSEDMQEMRRRLFWAVFIKDRWTSTGKGYPLMISFQDIDLDQPQTRNLDPGHQDTPHHFFVELLQQSIVLGKCHPVAYRADRFQRVTVKAFREVEAEVAELGDRLRRFSAKFNDYDSKATLELNYAALKLIFYGPFFRPTNPAEAVKFAEFIPNIPRLRMNLARDAVYALEYASKELVHSCPAIWGIGYYAQVRCFLVALSIKNDVVTEYPQDLREESDRACQKVTEIARSMCEEKRWSFKVMSGTLVLFCAAVADQQVEERRKNLSSPSSSLLDQDTAELTPSTDTLEDFAMQTDSSSNMYQKTVLTHKRNLDAYQQMSEDNGMLPMEQHPHQHQQQMSYRLRMSIPENEVLTTMGPYNMTPPFASAPILDSPINMIPSNPGNFNMFNNNGNNFSLNWDMGTSFQQDYDTFK